jgi:hypothetical protein
MSNIMNSILNLKRRVMARVYLEYVKSTFMEYPDYFMFGLFVLTSFVLILVHEISVNDVLNNMPKDNFSSTLNFFWVAIWNTSWIIQALIAGFFIRVIVGGSISTYKSIKNINSDWTNWITTKLKY